MTDHRISRLLFSLTWLSATLIIMLALELANSYTTYHMLNCSYGTRCYLYTSGNGCFLEADNLTISVNSNVSDVTANACLNNLTIPCYYSRVDSSFGDIVGSSLYLSECRNAVPLGEFSLVIGGIGLMAIIVFWSLELFASRSSYFE